MSKVGIIACVLCGDGPLRHDGKLYMPGDAVEMTEVQAEAKLASGRLKPVGGKTVERADQDAIVVAIKALDPAVKENWMGDGRPQVKAIEKALGLQISAADRDAAWDAIPEAERPRPPAGD